jgi:O-methyltransferase
VDNTIIFEVAQDNLHMTDIDRLANIYHLLSQVLVFEVPGNILEIGCNEGKTSIFLRMIMNYYSPNRELHVYDSFEGLPKKSEFDLYSDEGECKATLQQLEENFRRWNLQLPVVHKGWFNETFSSSIPEPVAFAYLDSDYYTSIRESLEYVYPLLSKNAIVVIDDYCDPVRNPRAWAGLPGVKKACDDFFAKKPEKISVLVGSKDMPMGYFRKQ